MLGSDYWDDHWSNLRLPVEVRKGDSLYADAITDVFDRYLGGDSRLSVLEIGGAPGQYAAYVWRRFGHDVAVLDNSAIGCARARENFELLGIPALVYEADMFAQPTRLFDVVYSLGVIEHVATRNDLVAMIAGHLNHLRPGGLLIVGCPNFRGLNRLFARRLSPSFLAIHNLDVMSATAWDEFEQAFGLERFFRDYVGGFEPSMFWRRERDRFSDRVLRTALHFSAKVLGSGKLRILRRFNSRAWSGFLMGVYRSPSG
jgi:SAM-dependent methyltransferase